MFHHDTLHYDNKIFFLAKNILTPVVMHLGCVPEIIQNVITNFNTDF